MRTGAAVLATAAALATPDGARAAAVTVTPAVAGSGEPVAVTGSEFPRRATGTVRLAGAHIGFRVDAHGRFSASLAAPAGGRRGPRMLVVHAGGRRLRTRVTLVRAPRGPSTLAALSHGQRVLVRPSSGTAGTALAVSGSHFRPRTTVTVRLGGVQVVAGRARRDGRFALTARAPAVPAGGRLLAVHARGTVLNLRYQLIAPPPPPPPAPPPPPPPDPVIAAAGDIACDPSDPAFNGGLGGPANCGEARTAATIATIAPSAVLPLGDIQYNSGAPAAFSLVYHPTWGRFDPIAFPVPGNHDYGSPGARGYFTYFGARAGPPGQGYYSFDLGAWHIVALNSNCQVVACGPGSAQQQWLQADLAAHPAACTLAFFHHPLFGSGHGIGDEPVAPFWDTLYAADADVILNGHAHNYERFAPQTPGGTPDPARGIRQFTVGTGGDDLQGFVGVAAQSEVRSKASFGVLALTLRATSYDWRFVPVAPGGFTDSGSGACH